jgi:D-alanyl-D-alanine carboxypeptidase
MKLFTTYAGLSLLGPEHVWRNRIYTDGTLRDGVLQGNLIVRGSGDPKLVVERLQALMAQVRAAGVREVRGDIVLDRSVFDVRERSEPFDDEPLRPYNVGPDGLLLNFKAVVYTFTPDAPSGQVQVRFEPPLAGFSAPTQLPLTQATPPAAANANGLWPTRNPKPMRRASCRPCGSKRAGNCQDRCVTARARPRPSCCWKRRPCPCPRSSRTSTNSRTT